MTHDPSPRGDITITVDQAIAIHNTLRVAATLMTMAADGAERHGQRLLATSYDEDRKYAERLLAELTARLRP